VHPREQGDWGELCAALWLTGQGATVSEPIGHSPDYDLIADFGDRILRVEVKTSTSFMTTGSGLSQRWRSRGQPQSNSGVRNTPSSRSSPAYRSPIRRLETARLQSLSR